MDYDYSKEEAVTDLYHKVAKFAISKTAYMVKSEEIAQDIVQDVFLKLWQKKLTFTTVEASYKWIYICCHNAAIDHLKSYAIKNQRPIPDTLTLPETVSERIANGEIIGILTKRLTTRQASILFYRYVDGHSLAEISDLNGLAKKTIQRELKQISQIGIQLKESLHDT